LRSKREAAPFCLMSAPASCCGHTPKLNGRYDYGRGFCIDARRPGRPSSEPNVLQMAVFSSCRIKVPSARTMIQRSIAKLKPPSGAYVLNVLTYLTYLYNLRFVLHTAW
jgi:hypothetical protein